MELLQSLCTRKDLVRKKVIWSSNIVILLTIEGSDWWIDVNATSGMKSVDGQRQAFQSDVFA